MPELLRPTARLLAKIHGSATRPFQGDCRRQLREPQLFQALHRDDEFRAFQGFPTWLWAPPDEEQSAEEGDEEGALAVTPTRVAPDRQDYGALTISGLSKHVCRTLMSRGITQLTDAQHDLMRAFLEGKDVLLHSHTGCGKSFGLMLALAHRLAEHPPDLRFTALVLVPTAALAAQMEHWLRLFCGHASHVCAVVSTGTGNSADDHLALLRRVRPLVVIATPDELLAVTRAAKAGGRRAEDCPVRQLRTNSQLVIIDEADQVIPHDAHPSSKDRTALLSSLIRRGGGAMTGAHWVPQQQVVAASATLSHHVRSRITHWMRTTRRERYHKHLAPPNPPGPHATVTLEDERGTVDKLITIVSAEGAEGGWMSGSVAIPVGLHFAFVVANSAAEIAATIYRIAVTFEQTETLNVPGLGIWPRPHREPTPATPRDLRILVFTEEGKTEAAAEMVRKGAGLPAEVYAGSERELMRLKTRLEEGEIAALVATRSTVRGLDFVGISHVFILGPPRAHVDLVHLAGRTARQGREGLAVTFASVAQTRLMRDVCRKAVPQMDCVRAADVAPGICASPADVRLAASGPEGGREAAAV